MENTAINLTTSELKFLLAKREKEERELLEKQKREYIAVRDNNIETLVDEAEQLGLALSRFKLKVHAIMDEQADKLAAYGKLRGNSKGGFAITNSSKDLKVVRRRDTEPVWDERAVKAIELIKDFLGTTIKKRDVKLYEILIKFLERNIKGDLEYSKVFGLMEHEDKFDDQRWREGLRLLKESYSISLKSFGYEFKQKTYAGKWDSLGLNFSSL